MISTEQYIEEAVEKHAIDVYGGVDKMPAHNKARLREMLRHEIEFEARREGLEEIGHSHSAVGDQFNMGTNE